MNKLLIPFLLLFFAINSFANNITSDELQYNELSTYLSITIKGDKRTLEAIKNDVNIQQLSHLKFIESNGNLTLKFSPYFEYELLRTFPELQYLNIAIPIKGEEIHQFDYYNFIKDTITENHNYLNLRNGYICTKSVNDTAQLNSILSQNLHNFHKSGWKATNTSDSVELYLYNKKILEFKVHQLLFHNDIESTSISIGLTGNGARKFENFTTMNVGLHSIFMIQNQILYIPLVNSPILGGNIQINIKDISLKKLFNNLVFQQYKDKIEILSVRLK